MCPFLWLLSEAVEMVPTQRHWEEAMTQLQQERLFDSRKFMSQCSVEIHINCHIFNSYEGWRKEKTRKTTKIHKIFKNSKN